MAALCIPRVNAEVRDGPCDFKRGHSRVVGTVDAFVAREASAQADAGPICRLPGLPGSACGARALTRWRLLGKLDELSKSLSRLLRRAGAET